MGCDIHLSVEKFDVESGQWIYVPGPVRVCWACEGKATVPKCYRCGGSGKTSESFYWERNYRVFVLLANVRNDGSITPISKPRGWPTDPSPEIAAAIMILLTDVDYGQLGDLEKIEILYSDHSASWLLLSELLLELDWDSKIDGEHTQTWKEAANNLFEIVQRDLVPLAEDPAHVRLVFGFDS